MGMNDSSFMGKGTWLGEYEGEHLCEIISVEEGITPGNGTTKTTIHVKVHRSNNEQINARIAGEGGPHAAELSYLRGDREVYYHSNQKIFLGCAYGVDPARMDFDWEAAFKAAKEENNLKGQIMIAQNYVVEGRTRKNNKPVINTNWIKPAPTQG